MQTTYRLNASELDEKFLEGLKATFQGQEIEIIVYALDETEYLLASPANRERLFAAKANIEQGKNQVAMEFGDLG
ncbi:MAG: hypothetical protein AAF609_03710 [Cyanobacteria bacterium P01_C01_bin.120]